MEGKPHGINQSGLAVRKGIAFGWQVARLQQ